MDNIEQSKPPTTTTQQDLVVAGQRRINLIWEFTQAFIAITVVVANMIVGIFDGINGKDVNVPFVLSSALFLIVGFYFSRTNHQAIGGLGDKTNEQQTYEGR